MSKIDEIIDGYIKSCEDNTGTLSRYWGYLKRQSSWFPLPDKEVKK